MNEEATMSRRGLDPVSRKTRTPGGRKKAGFCVYLAYQLLDRHVKQISKVKEIESFLPIKFQILLVYIQ